MNTGSRPLLECTTDLFWGTGWVIDSPKWDEPYDYLGKNNLVKILQSIRETYLPVTSLSFPTLKANDGKNFTSTPMPKNAPKSSKKRKNFQSNNPPSKQPMVASIGCVADMKTNEVLVGTVVQAGMNSGISAVVNKLEDTPSYDIHREVSAGANPVEQEKEQLMESQVQEVDELTFSDTLYQSYNAKNVTNRDGSLNVEKIRSWGLPALNTSCLMEVTGFGTDESRQKLGKLLSAQNAGESYIDTDPHKGTPVELKLSQGKH